MRVRPSLIRSPQTIEMHRIRPRLERLATLTVDTFVPFLLRDVYLLLLYIDIALLPYT